ncbi:LOW QUALITY PROTEIN: zinc finger and SCAN domain-containing protein 4 [Dipodomys merriami]|uniref:LOW QUALITY PROTEIN: zinc finger and SCAN domain-containing protein 4 n=1 Tax=Dipodomys merriami TaxID=94247 RepID=UPI003855A0D3
MTLSLQQSFQHEPSLDNLAFGNLEFNPTHASTVKKEEVSVFSSSQLKFPQHSSNLGARQELQRLYQLFHSWLQPEKHRKEEIISQLVLDQFIISGYCKDKTDLKEKWESSGRSLEKLLEVLTDDCVKTPDLVHVHMQGREALFSEHMPLREVIFHFKQMLAETPTGGTAGMFSGTASDPALGAGNEAGYRNGWKTTQADDSLTTGQGNHTAPLYIFQKENGSRTDEEGFLVGTPEEPLGPKKFLKRPNDQDGPSEGQLEFFSMSVRSFPELNPTHQSNDKHQGRSSHVQKVYQCKECSKTFTYLSRFLAHQKRHRNERPFLCAKCHKGFYQASDLRRVHQIIHTTKKPFVCSRCEKSFSHRTNLQAHERIHTGEKPYTCSLCQRSYRQSSTYHCHLRIHQTHRTHKCFTTKKADSKIFLPGAWGGVFRTIISDTQEAEV